MNTRFKFVNGPPIWIDETMHDSKIYTLNTNDIRIEPMKDNWTPIHEEFARLDRQARRMEIALYAMTGAMLALLVALGVMIGGMK